MKRRRRVPCDHPAPLGLIEQYEEVLRLRHEIHLAETDEHAARLPSDIPRADRPVRNVRQADPVRNPAQIRIRSRSNETTGYWPTRSMGIHRAVPGSSFLRPTLVLARTGSDRQRPHLDAGRRVRAFVEAESNPFSPKQNPQQNQAGRQRQQHPEDDGLNSRHKRPHAFNLP